MAVILKGTRFGDIEVDDKRILDFPLGIIGFERLRRFVLVNHSEKVSWLQSVDEPGLAFPVAPASVISKDYSLCVDDSMVAPLGGPDPSSMAIFFVLVIPKDVMKTTANLRAPVVISFETMRGMQLLIDSADYPVRYPIFEYKARERHSVR